MSVNNLLMMLTLDARMHSQSPTRVAGNQPREPSLLLLGRARAGSWSQESELGIEPSTNLQGQW